MPTETSGAIAGPSAHPPASVGSLWRLRGYLRPHLWSLLMLEFWFRQCVDGAAAGEPLEYAVLKAVA